MQAVHFAVIKARLEKYEKEAIKVSRELERIIKDKSVGEEF